MRITSHGRLNADPDAAAKAFAFIWEQQMKQSGVDGQLTWDATHRVGTFSVVSADGRSPQGTGTISFIPQRSGSGVSVDATYTGGPMFTVSGPATSLVMKHFAQRLFRQVDAVASSISGVGL